MSALSPAREGILSVGALTRMIRASLEDAFPAVWVRGEVMGLMRAESGHLYFSLREGEKASLGCVMFRSDALRLSFEPADGAEVEAFGSITVYELRGRYQLVARELRPAGLGALLVQLERLKRKLHAEGLFDPERKRSLPRYPRRIGIVTSPVGAAVRDLVTVLTRRWPAIEIILCPTRVQGPEAAGEIAAAIQRFNRYGAVDLLVVGRGGGSLEDLWAFSEEIVVRAIAGSQIPVISAVGHEVDTTLADLAADVRAATPSNAAEIAVRDRAEVSRHLVSLAERASAALRHGLAERRHRLTSLIEQYGFRRQRDALGFLQQRIDDWTARLESATRALLRAARARLQSVRMRYGLRELPRAVAARRARGDELGGRLAIAITGEIQAQRGRLAGLEDRLRALSPRLVLERGFCIARRPDGTLVRSALALGVGDPLALEFARGEADARIEAVRGGEDHGG